jgi:acyl dehydratase
VKGFFVGQKADRQRRFNASEVAAYRVLTGDVGLGYAAVSAPEKTVPGPLLGGLISDLLGTTLPGPGTNWLKQRYRFHEPALVDQTLSAAVEITRLRPEKALVNLAVTIIGPAGELICSGEALVLVKELAAEAGMENS